MKWLSNAPVSNALATPCFAERLVSLSSKQDLDELASQCQRDGQRLLVLGEASNVVLPDRLNATVARWSCSDVRFEEVGTDVRVTADAGLGWHELVRRCVARGLWGIENLALIPGSVGAAPIQNIGAYGVELGDRLESVDVFDLASGQWRVLAAKELQLGYRTSRFKREPGLIVSRVTIRLRRDASPELSYAGLSEELAAMAVRPSARAVMEAVIRIRRRKLPDPHVIPNVGSFFHNPTLSARQWHALKTQATDMPGFELPTGDWKVPAAALIERCGYKAGADVRAERLGVWYRQPLVLINPQGSSGEDVLRFAEQIEADVHERFGIRLQQEPGVIAAS